MRSPERSGQTRSTKRCSPATWTSRRFPRLTFSSGPPASSAFRTSCSGSPPMPNWCFSTPSGPTSTGGTCGTPARSSPAATAGTAAPSQIRWSPVQPSLSNLSASWVQQTEAMGYGLMPTFVGLQAPCNSFSGKIDPKQAASQGTAAANQAVTAAKSYGLGAGSPVYYDMEAYNHTNAGCRTAVLTVLDAWTRQLKAVGYVSGVYSSASAAVTDLQSNTTIAGHPLAEPQAIWFALWDNANSMTGAPYMTTAVWPVASRSAAATQRPVPGSPRDSSPPTASRMETFTMALRSDRLDAIVSLSKRRGFVYPSSEIYGGLRAAWDYGPLGVELKNNIKRQWWRAMVTERDDIVGLDSSVILAREVWEASGHVTEFVDPLTECMSCHKRYRADHLIEAYEEKHGHPPVEGLKEVACPNCGTRGAFTEPRMFNGLLRTHLGPVEDESGLAYLRPETAQGIFINFRNVLQTSRRKIPFGIGPIGKSFRNEITPGNFIFRTREFEQMEMEFFVRPGTDEEWHQTWIDTRFAWYTDLGIRPGNLRKYEHPKEKLSHYSKRTVDIEYKFDFTGTEWGELEGIANRTDYDLTTHQRASKQDMSYLDQESGERFIPYVIEPAAGVDRGALVFLLDAYAEDEAPDAKGKLEKRTVLRLDRRLAPVKVAVLPLSRNADLSPKARDLAAALRKRWNTEFDDASAIGRRYRRQDEIGTPYCVTVDFDTLNDQAVTVRERDTMHQERVGIDALETYLSERLTGC